MQQTIKVILVLATFMFCHFIMRQFWGAGWSEAILAMDNQSRILLSLATYSFLYGPLIVVSVLLFKQKPWYEVLGLRPNDAGKYLLAALACCIPMIVGYAYLSTNISLSIAPITTGSIFPGFFEELIFRGALFGVLFRFCRWGFIPAALVSSIIFGLGHIYQGHDLSTALLAVAVTSVAGTWFAWLYCECEYRLWFPIGMHILMNAAYGIFGMTGGAAGDLQGNVFKATAIVLSLVYIQLLINKGKQREVTLSRLWVNNKKPMPATQPQQQSSFTEKSYV
jgi:membrane protease YdiL (CAAX protease family)